MASIKKVVGKKGKPSWRVSIRRGKHKANETFYNEQDAKRFASEHEAKVARLIAEEKAEQERAATPPRGSEAFKGALLGEVLKRWGKECKGVSACRIKNLPTVVTHVKAVAVGDARQRWANEYIRRLREEETTKRHAPFAWATIAVHLSMIYNALKWWAVECDYDGPLAPFARTGFPKNWDHERERRLSPDEEGALFKAIGERDTDKVEHWELLVKLAAETGGRQQELVWAEWKDVRFDLEPIGGWIIPKAHCKTDVDRVVPMTPRARACWERLRELAKPGDPKVFHCFPSKASVSATFHKIVLEAGIADFRMHDLRHEAITKLTADPYSRAHTALLMHISGHSEIRSFNRYMNARPEEVVKKFAELQKGGEAPIVRAVSEELERKLDAKLDELVRRLGAQRRRGGEGDDDAPVPCLPAPAR